MRIACVLGLLAIAAAFGAGEAWQPTEPLLPVGVVYRLAADPHERRRDLEEMERLRFDVVVPRTESTSADAMVLRIDRLLGGELLPRAAIEPAGPPARIEVLSGAQAPLVNVNAWAALAGGARAVVFDDWRALQQEPHALEAAAEFAGHVTRNAGLYAPLRPRTGTDDIRVEGAGGAIDAAFLESPQALVLIAVNRRAEPQTPVLTFSPDIPEAIWQNMLTGGAVNFVAGPEGPTYAHTFAPYDVLVLLIQRKWR